jgi:CheY-like chemotaxis protein
MKKIVIPEDIHLILEKEQSFLKRSGVRIFTVSSNKQALVTYRDERADLIIAKIDTPEMSGEMLCSLIREDKELRNVSLILICADTESEFKRCMKCRANAFFTVPINHAALLQEVHHLLHIAPRKLIRVPLSIKIFGKSRDLPFIGYTENISVSGMLMHSDTLLFEGDTISCSFYLPDSTHITTNAEVIRSPDKESEHDTNCYGIKFLDLSPGNCSAIERFIVKESRQR